MDAASLGVRYVGTPERGGHWIDAAHWDAAQAAWVAAIAAEDAAAAAQARGTTDRTRDTGG